MSGRQAERPKATSYILRARHEEDSGGQCVRGDFRRHIRSLSSYGSLRLAIGPSTQAFPFFLPQCTRFITSGAR